MSSKYLFLTALATVLLMAGCGGSAPPPGANVEPEPPAPASSTPIETTSLPADFPKDVPLYEGSKVEAVSAMPDSGTYVVQGRTADVLEKVEVTLRQAAEAQGWKAQITTAAPIPDMAIANYDKADRMLNITLFRDDRGTAINLTTGPKQSAARPK
ncbi:MAG: hypothetical protein IT365_13315 [Candidatus Hydrogenedentes bacterium]|nr:hypothetical protein [Candidatus Hydrogenedentota bacterium]